MMRIYVVFLCFIFAMTCMSFNVAANIDSLLQIATAKRDTNAVNSYRRLGNNYMKMDKDTSLMYLEKSLELAAELGYKIGMFDALQSIGVLQAGNGKYEESLAAYSHALKIVEEEKLSAKQKVGILNNLGIAHYIAGNVGAAIEPYIEAVGICRENGLDKDRARLLNNLGVFFRKAKRYEEAIEIYKESYELRAQAKDTLGMANNYFNISGTYVKLENYEKTMESISKAEELFAIVDSQEDLLLCKIIRGNALVELGRMAEAYIVLAPLGMQENYEIETVYKHNLFLSLARVYKARSNYNKALQILNRIEKSVENDGYLDSKISFYKIRSSIFLNKRNYPKYDIDVKRYIALKDSLNTDYQKELVAEMETKFKTKEKDFKIQLLNTQKEFTEEKLSSTKIQRSGLLAVLVILAGLFAYLFSLNKKITTKNSLLEAADNKNKELMNEIHHRVKNNLQVMSSLLSLQARKTTDDATKVALTSSKSRVQAMSILHQNLYERGNFTEIKSDVYFLDLVDNIQDIYRDRTEVEISTDLDEIVLDVDTLVAMGLIVNELICNAYKHAFLGRSEGHVELKVKEIKSGNIIISVKDDGHGADENYLSEKRNSLGTKLISSFVKSLKGKVEITSEQGLEVEIRFNISKNRK